MCGLCRYKNRSVLSYHYYCWLIDQKTTYKHYESWQRVVCDDIFGPLVMTFFIFTAHHNAHIASAVLATAIPSVCLTDCMSVLLSHAGIVLKPTARSTVQFALTDSKMCLVL